MTTTPITDRSLHPIRAAIARAEETLRSADEFDPMYLSVEDQRGALADITRLENELAARKLRLVASAGDLAAQDAARNPGEWLTQHTTVAAPTARRDWRLAVAVEERWKRIGKAMAAGLVSVEQALIAVRTLDDLPTTLRPKQVKKAEKQLVAWRQTFRPEELRQLARTLLEVIAPELFEADDAKRLLEEERSAAQRMNVSFRTLEDGMERATIDLPRSRMSRLRTYLEAFTSPRSTTTGPMAEESRIPYGRRLAHAFCALFEHLDPTKLPTHGGDATTLMVTISLDDLKNQLGTGQIIDTDLTTITATEARRLACTAQIIPAVLGGNSEILDLGRADRLFRPPQRKALRLRDKRCRIEGCDIPAPWCEAHHLTPWSQGGQTNLANGILACSHHHHRLHDPAYEHEVLPNGDIRIRKRRR